MSMDLGTVIDVDVAVGGDNFPMRLVGVRVADGRYRFYLTNVGRDLGPHQIADIYRVRWEIEVNNKLDKSSHRLDEIDARGPDAVRALLHASMIGSILIGTIVHRHNRATGTTKGLRKEAPLHHGLVARMVAQAAFRTAETFARDEVDAATEWDRIADLIVHMGKDPNWRTKPSVLDQLRGWPAPAKSTRLSSRAKA